MEQLNLPHVLLEIANQPRGLIVATAPTGSGKSTILAAMINHINMTKPVHILTYRGSCRIYILRRVAVVRQREIEMDVKDFSTALKSALREDLNVILVGEMRDYETISQAVTAAETGHMGTLYTTSDAYH